jgi:membrane-bound lytic murein transglycosylase A
MKKILPHIIFSLPIVFFGFFGQIQSIEYREIRPPECQLKKWNLPVLSKIQQQKYKSASILLQRPSVTCCQDDSSCLDQLIYQGENGKTSDKKALLTAIDHSLQYLKTSGAIATYKKYPVVGITRDRVIKSLQRFREILLTTNSPTALHTAIANEFVFYQSIGQDHQGTVLFTAYYEPLYVASRTPTAEYLYPVYRLPPNLNQWSKPHPARVELEGADGLQGAKGQLKGLELFWFRDRLEPYLAQIEGSARLQLTDGTQTTIGYAGNTAYDYQSIGRELVKDGKLPAKGVTMPMILDYFHKYPQELSIYIPRDPSFVFFQENHGAPAQGSIGKPLTAERSIATDKSLMPPGALALIRGAIPLIQANNQIEFQTVSRYVLDQDTGGAIKGAGRVDYFLGTGKLAGDRAGVTVSYGQLFYLLLKPDN